MNFFEAVKSAFSKYGTIAGRSLRSEFWYFQLFFFVACNVLIFINIINRGDYVGGGMGPMSPIFVLVVIPNIAVTARRLHDVDRSPWWAFIAFTIIGLIPFLYWMCKKGDEGENRFGPEPLASDKKQ